MKRTIQVSQSVGRVLSFIGALWMVVASSLLLQQLQQTYPDEPAELAAHVEGRPVQGLVDEENLGVPILRETRSGCGVRHDFNLVPQYLLAPPFGLGHLAIGG